jgi:hypothetical protein
MAKAFALIMVLLTCRDRLREEMIWIIDNQPFAQQPSEAQALLKMYSFVQTSVFMALEIHCRIWYRWIDSGSNISDGLSRIG